MIPDLYYLIPIGVLAGTNLWTVWAWQGCSGWRAYHAKWHRKWRALAEQSTAAVLQLRERALEIKSELDAIKSARSAAVAKGNHTRALKAKALRDATTAQLDGEVRAKARKLRVAA